MDNSSHEPLVAEPDDEAMRSGEDIVHKAFGVLRRQLTEVSSGFLPHVLGQIIQADPRRANATLTGLLRRVVVETLNAGSRLTDRTQSGAARERSGE